MKSWVRLLTLCGLGFAVLASYELSRSSVESLFIEQYGSEALPQVWLLVAAGAMAVVGVYNHFAARYDLLKIYASSVLVSLAVLTVLLLGVAADLPFVRYGLYVWKDIYIVVLVEIFWTVANSVYDARHAKWHYGLFLVAGTLGALSGGLGVGWIAERWGTTSALFGVYPTLLVSLLAVPAFRDAHIPRPKTGEKTSIGDGMRVLRNSSYLLLMLGLIVAVQLAINLVDYQYNVALEAAYPDTDARTAVGGQVYAAINVASLALQAATGPVLSLLGVGRTLVVIPLFLLGALGMFLVIPRFTTMAVAKVASKCFDYSVFRAAKEMLYIPLSYDEKTRGKALIDIMTYRMAKGGASLALMLLLYLELGTMVIWLAIAVIVVWLLLSVVIARRYAELEPDPDADRASPVD